MCIWNLHFHSSHYFRYKQCLEINGIILFLRVYIFFICRLAHTNVHKLLSFTMIHFFFSESSVEEARSKWWTRKFKYSRSVRFKYMNTPEITYNHCWVLHFMPFPFGNFLCIGIKINVLSLNGAFIKMAWKWRINLNLSTEILP